MANPDYEFVEGFDKYGPTGIINLSTGIVAGEWSSLTGGSVSIIASLFSSGYALSMVNLSGTNDGVTRGISKTLPSNYARCVGGCYVSFPTIAASKFVTFAQFKDGSTVQVALAIDSNGNILAYRGDLATLLGTASVGMAANSVHCIEWDVTIHNSAGIVKVWLDGILTTINLSSQNTRSSANNYLNAFLQGTGTYASNPPTINVDHLYLWLYTASGGAETPALTNPIVETQFATSDSAVAFAFGAAVVGTAYQTTSNTNAPGANELVLRKYTPAVSGTINSVQVLPGATSAGAKFKGVIYADSSGAPGSLLSSGTEVVGATSGTNLNLPLVTPQSITAGTPYWIGYITDTSLAMQQSDSGTSGYKAANTYGSGAPGTAPAMTSGQASWLIYGLVTGVATNWNQSAQNPALGDLSYNSSSNNGDEDLYNFPALSSTPSNIYTVAVKANLKKTDAGARTIDLRMKSVSTSSSGSTTGQAAPLSYSWLDSYFRTDPNTSAAWTASGLNAAKSGHKLGSP